MCTLGAGVLKSNRVTLGSLILLYWVSGAITSSVAMKLIKFNGTNMSTRNYDRPVYYLRSASGRWGIDTAIIDYQPPPGVRPTDRYGGGSVHYQTPLQSLVGCAAGQFVVSEVNSVAVEHRSRTVIVGLRRENPVISQEWNNSVIFTTVLVIKTFLK